MRNAIHHPDGLAERAVRCWGNRPARRLRIFTWLALGLFLSACSSTGNAPLTSGSLNLWTTVQGIDRGADLLIAVDCALAAEHELCMTPAEGDESTVRVVSGKYVEADGQGLLFRPQSDDDALLRVDRGMVQSVDVVKGKSNFLGTLVGAGIGPGLLTIGGFTTSTEDFGPSEKAMILMFVSLSGGGIGYVLDRLIDREVTSGARVVRIYQR